MIALQWLTTLVGHFAGIFRMEILGAKGREKGRKARMTFSADSISENEMKG